jgi:hypothetical protein
MLDCALQGLYAAFSAPGDGRLWSIVAPTYIRRVTLIPDLCGENMTGEVAIDCMMSDARELGGDVDVYLANFERKIIEIEGIKLSPFAPATAEDDRYLFQESFLCLDKPDAVVVCREQTPKEKQKTLDAERAAFYYLKNLHLSVSHEERGKLPWYRQALIGNAERIYNQVQDGKHSFAPPSWINDMKEEIFDMMDRYDALTSLTADRKKRHRMSRYIWNIELGHFIPSFKFPKLSSTMSLNLLTYLQTHYLVLNRTFKFKVAKLLGHLVLLFLFTASERSAL